MTPAFMIIAGLVICGLALSVRRIPASPPHIAVVTVFGRRTGRIKHEGLRFFPLSPWITNGILINMTKQAMTLPQQIVRTADHVEVGIEVSITWTPSEQYAVEYLNAGGDTGIRNNLEAMLKERVREWASNQEGGWVEALRVTEALTARLAKDIGGIPTTLSVEEERALVARVRSGLAEQTIKGLGIILNRLNVSELNIRGKVGAEADIAAYARLRMAGQRIDFDLITEILKKLMALGFTADQSIELVQIERDKVEKKVREYRGSAAAATLSAVEKILGADK